MHNVLSVAEICSGCGMCESICPTKAITLTEKEGFLRPQIEESKCILCGKCTSMCPSKNKNIEVVKWNMFKYRAYGHSLNICIREEAASGGITSELLKYLLDNCVVDYVVTADEYYCDRKAKYTLIHQNESDKIYKYLGSNYCPVNIGKAITEIKKTEGACAIVCLPCLARGIRNAINNDVELRSRIRFVISLLCNHIPSYYATDYLIKKYNISNPRLIKYRGCGWLGKLRVYDSLKRDNEVLSLPYSEYYSSNFATSFWQRACIECWDHFGKEADVSMGDADFIKCRDKTINNTGETMVFSNNPEIEKILKRMQNEGIIDIKNDVSDEELELIYGPLSNMDRASDRNLRNNYIDVLSEEKRDQVYKKIKRFISLPVRTIKHIKRSIIEHKN